MIIITRVSAPPRITPLVSNLTLCPHPIEKYYTMVMMATVTTTETASPLILLLVPGGSCRIVPIDATVCPSCMGLGSLMLRQPTTTVELANATVVTPPPKKIALRVRQEVIATTAFTCMDFQTIQNTNPSRS